MTASRTPRTLSRFVATLRSLVSECERSAEMLHRAAEKLSDPSLKPMLDAYALRRDVTVAQLAATLVELGTTPTVATGWVSGPREGDGDLAIVGAIERSEAKILQRFQRIFQLDVPRAAQGALQRCVDEIATVSTVLNRWLAPMQLRPA
jgi:hypothetical protein